MSDNASVDIRRDPLVRRQLSFDKSNELAAPADGALDHSQGTALNRRGPLRRWSSLIEVLEYRARVQASLRAYTFIDSHGRETESLTFGELHARVVRLSARLRARFEAGERALLIFPTCASFIVAFLACLRAGVVAVPMSPPRRGRSAQVAQTIALNSGAVVVLTTGDLMEELKIDLPMVSLQWIAADVDAAAPRGFTGHHVRPDHLAFLQYTSGSTSSPKGVMVDHRNLMANQEVMYQAFEHTPGSTVVGWAPLFHDQGLIGNFLHPLFAGTSCVLMAPFSFIKRPLTWLNAISHYRAHTSGGPNFAFDLCVRHATPDRLRGLSLDLGSWTVAFNGAEPLRADTMERFSRTFAPYGFRREAFKPCYGLAEATLYVTGARVGCGPTLRSVSRMALAAGRVSTALVGDTSAQLLVGSGTARFGVKVCIADPVSRAELSSDEIGEIWVAGESVARGYWNQAEATCEVFEACLSGGEGPFLRTGDLGFLDRHGELFVTGRIKDLIIVMGRNHYPQDIERSMEESHPALRAGAGAAFTIDIAGEERLILVQELERDARTGVDWADITVEIRRAVVSNHDLVPHAILLVRAGTIPKTTSGKIQRQLLRQWHLAGELDAQIVFGATALPSDRTHE